jgi:uncharacterized protein (TIGR00297 family)
LTVDGAVAATLVGGVVFGLGGLGAAAALIAFFVSGSLLSRRLPRPGEVQSAKGARRDATQVLANGGVAALAACAAARGNERARGALLGSLAAAAADTWASEIGVLSRTPPRSIVGGRIVAPGTSGGVTTVGWLAAAAGGLAVGITYGGVDRPRGLRAVVAAALVSGLVGSAVDSVLGATIQAAYRCPDCGAISDAARDICGAPAERVRGWAWVTNDVVNLAATTVGGVVGSAVWPSGACATLGREALRSRRCG